MKTFVRVKARVFFSAVSAVVFSGLLLVGCGGGGGGGSVEVSENPLVLPDGEAWADVSEGYIFNRDFSVNRISRNNYDGIWSIIDTGAYTLDENNTVSIDFGTGNSITGTWGFDFSEDSTRLVIHDRNNPEDNVKIFTKTPVSFSTTGPGTGDGLVLQTGQAWLYSDDGRTAMGYIFRENGVVFEIDYGYSPEGGWRAFAEGTYEVHGVGGTGITIVWNDERGHISGTYVISGTMLTLTINGRELPIVCLRRNNVNIELP
ncbi:MAG: hypothetical protein LBB74_07195 [Chitinispirillales bacterium]|jgi:hypothetical protein|nr:hypothetical protein [Chitinispirillales bacterium]